MFAFYACLLLLTALWCNQRFKALSRQPDLSRRETRWMLRWALATGFLGTGAISLLFSEWVKPDAYGLPGWAWAIQSIPLCILSVRYANAREWQNQVSKKLENCASADSDELAEHD